MKRLLVLTDFSPTARRAEQVGMKLAKRGHNELHFYHTIITPIDWVKLSLDKEKLYPEIKERIAYAKSELATLNYKCKTKQLNCKTFLTFDRGGENLPQFVNKNNCDLVIMGSHGENGLGKLMGSNANHVINQTQKPVLVIKLGTRSVHFNEIIIGSDSQFEICNMIKAVNDLSSIRPYSTYILTSDKEGEGLSKSISLKFPKQKINIITLKSGNLIHEIQRIALGLSSPLVVNDQVQHTTFPLNIFSENYGMTLNNLPDLPVLNVNM